MKKNIITLIKWGILLFILYVILGALIPYLFHKRADMSEFPKNLTYYSEGNAVERVMSIDDNMDALIWRLRLIDSAHEEIVLSTFDFMTDESGTDIISALYRAADRGVQVRLLVDGMIGFVNLKGHEVFHTMVNHPNVTVKFYNPINLLKPWTLNARLHDKYLMADRKAYILGGRNLHNLFLGDYSNSKNEDRDLLIYVPDGYTGTSSAEALYNYFEGMWEQDCNKVIKNRNINIQAKLQTELAERYEKLKMRLKETYDIELDTYCFEDVTYKVNQISILTNPKEPNNKRPVLWEALCKYMEQGSNITIQTPYIVCSKNMYEDLETVVRQTDSVEIVTNAIESGANPWGCMDYLTQKSNILDTGVSVYEMLGKHSTHKKTVLIDDNISIVGSYNLDMRSTYLDTEIMLVIDCQELNQKLRVLAEADMLQSRHVTPDGEINYGENYEARELSVEKRILYKVFKYLTIPIRYLL